MQFPIPFKDLLPIETVKQLSQLVTQPTLMTALKDAAQKLGINKESLQPAQLQQILLQAGRWMESVSEPWLQSAQPGLTPGINATGEVFSTRWCSHRMSPEVVHLHARLQSQFAETNKLDSQLRLMLMGVTGAPDAFVVPNVSIALYLIAQLKQNEGKKNWVLPRMDCIRLPLPGSSTGANVRTILDNAKATTTEIGSVQDCTLQDFETAIANNETTLLLASPTSINAPAGAEHRRWAYDAAQKRNSPVVELMLDGTIHDGDALGGLGQYLPNCWQKQTEFLIVPADGFLGGPECAIILGQKDRMDALHRLTETLGWYASYPEKAMLLRTLQISERVEDWRKLPIGTTLTTSLENLENRSKRLKVQLESLPDFERVSMERKSCRLGAGAWANLKVDSWILQLFPKSLSPSSLSDRMAAFSTPVWGNVQSDHVELVLRSVGADEDRIIVQMFTPTTHTEPETAS
jgi:seryl-tRNA(Sec) selenium transferase